MSSAPQTTVNTAPPKGVPGFTTDDDSTTDPGLNAEATAAIPFGVMTAQSAEGKIKLIAAQADKLAGPSVHQNALDRTDQLDTGGVQPAAVISTGRKWRGWVKIDETVAVGDAVRYRTSGAGGGAGCFRKTASAGVTNNASLFAQWRTGGTNTEGVAELEIDMTMAGLVSLD